MFSFAPPTPIVLRSSSAPSCSRPPRFLARARSANRSRKSARPGRGRAAKRSALYDALAAYCDHFSPLIAAERAAEQAAALALCDPSRPQGQLEAEGVALFGLVVQHAKRPRVFSNAVYAMRPHDGRRIPDANRFAVGDLVSMCYPGALLDEDSIEATVMRKTPFGIEVSVPLSSNANRALEAVVEDASVLDVYRGTSAVAYERAQNALELLTTLSSNVTPLKRLVACSLRSRLILDDASHQRRNGPVGLVADLMSDKRPDSEWEEQARERVRLDSNAWTPSKGLNGAQIHAVRSALARTMTLIHGPPGTGKTTTAAHVVAGALTEGRGPVLAAAASNTAADALLSALVCVIGPRVRVLRIGRLGAVAEVHWPRTLDAALERDGEVRQARANDDARALAAAEQAAALRAVASADVVVTTCAAAGRDALREARFPFVLVDEATQATEPDALVALAVGGGAVVRQLVLAGDHHQLPPTVLSDGDQALSVSLFARMWDAGVASRLLDVQYRMHPGISAFPSRRFYGGRVRDAVTALERPLPLALHGGLLDGGPRALFVDVRGKEERGTLRDSYGARLGFSYSNRAEADAVVRVLRMLLSDGGFAACDIGVISPYVAQTRSLRQMVGAWASVSELEIKTVDGFQGREKEVIVMSAVRCNDNGEVGFLADWRRLNVSLTRAKTLLVMVGSESTLRSDENWNAWLRWVDRSKGRLRFWL